MVINFDVLNFGFVLTSLKFLFFIGLPAVLGGCSQPSIDTGLNDHVSSNSLQNSLSKRPLTFEAHRSSSQVCVRQDHKVHCYAEYASNASTISHFEFDGLLEISLDGNGLCANDGQGIQCLRQHGGSVYRPDIPNPKSLQSDYGFSCAISEGLGVECWGSDNSGGRLSAPPSRNPKDLAIGGYSSCLLDEEDGVKCWGTSGDDQLPLLLNPRKLSGSLYTKCVVTDDGPKCWGSGAEACTNAFKNGPAIERFVMSSSYCCAVGTDQSLRCNGVGEPLLSEIKKVGIEKLALSRDDNQFFYSTPSGFSRVSDLYKLMSIPEMGHKFIPTDMQTSISHTCVRSQSEVKCWGDNSFNQLSMTSISAGAKLILTDGSTCALNKNVIQCAGNLSSLPPPSLTNVKAVTPVGRGLCFIDGNQVVCWGTSRKFEEPLSNPRGITYSEGFCVMDDDILKCTTHGNRSQYKLSNFVKMVSSAQNECVLQKEIGVACFGLPWFRVRNVPDLKNPRDLAMGDQHACAIDDDGVKCWGLSVYNQLDVPPLKNPRMITAAGKHTCALHDYGVACWGEGQDFKWE